MKEANFKILIADENIVYRNNLASRLRIAGYNVEFATGGFHLLHLLEKYRDYNLVIIHENMNDMPGEEILSLVRVNKSKTELPVIFITSTSANDNNLVMEIIKSGANDLVVKNANFQPVVDKVTKYFTLLKNS